MTGKTPQAHSTEKLKCLTVPFRALHAMHLQTKGDILQDGQPGI